MPPVVSPVRSDEQIKKDVVDHLYADGRVDASDVNAEVSKGKVILTGNVPSCTARRAARDDAFGVLGVRGVRNQLTVLRTATTLSDDEVRANAKSVLEWSSDIDPSNIQVDVSGGAVSLSGSVTSYWQRTLAERMVANIDGVLGVQNELTVVPSEDVLDEAIAESIEASLRRSSCVSADDVTVKVEQGVVTLSGVVPSCMASRITQEAAHHTTGVRDVRSDLSVAEYAGPGPGQVGHHRKEQS